ALALTIVLLACAGYGRHLQVARGASLLQKARTQMTRCVSLPAPRGLITDRHGAVLAGNADQSEVAAIPTVLRRNRPAVEAVAGLLGRPAADVAATTAGRITAARVPGVVLLPSPKRLYPSGSLVASFFVYDAATTEKDHKR